MAAGVIPKVAHSRRPQIYVFILKYKTITQNIFEYRDIWAIFLFHTYFSL